MRDQEWDDDSAYRAAVRRTRIMMAIALVVSLLVLGLIALAVFGTVLFVGLAEFFAR
ncbi:hypothetical protein ACFVP0_01730 [Streptomyces cinereoruber]|uniref:hypothetical protein n=1 Tax=Streptomyces cinereoruber TaxID=67260 RepID=UPI00368A23FA